MPSPGLFATPGRRRLVIAGAATLASVAVVAAVLAVSSSLSASASGGAPGAGPASAAASGSGSAMPSMPSMPSMPGMVAIASMPPSTGAARTERSSAVATPQVSTAGFPSGPRQPGIFTDRCAYSHEAADDPILAPGQPGAAMHHDFYGNAATDAASTAPQLVGGSTTCSTSADASAYWTPVLYQDQAALTPSSALIYWRRPARDAESVQTIPPGLQMIAGDETATAPQPTSVVSWTCTGELTLRDATDTPHDCANGSQLRVVVFFPSCWDGKTLDGRGQTDVVYRTATGCPSSHPVQIPQLVFHVSYPTSSAAGLLLSMTPTMAGSTDTEHVDFVNGWQQNVLTADVAACDATSTRCGPVTGATATPRGPVTAIRNRTH